MSKNKHIGPSFESFLEEEGIKDQVYEVAQRRVLAYQLAEAMKVAGVTKSELARRMNTSRTQVDALLDPENVTFKFDTARKAARAVGKSLQLAFV